MEYSKGKFKDSHVKEKKIQSDQSYKFELLCVCISYIQAIIEIRIEERKKKKKEKEKKRLFSRHEILKGENWFAKIFGSLFLVCIKHELKKQIKNTYEKNRI